MRAILAMFTGFLVLVGCGSNDNQIKPSLQPINSDKVLHETEKNIRLMHDTDCDP